MPPRAAGQAVYAGAAPRQYGGMTDWIIRPALPEDATALARCMDAAYARYTNRLASLPDVSAGIGEDIRDNTVWVAVAGQRIVGGAILISDNGDAILANVGVLPDCGGRSIGRALIAKAESHARQTRARRLRLTTHADMPQNVAFYTALGWHETGRSGDKIMMAKAL